MIVVPTRRKTDKFARGLLFAVLLFFVDLFQQQAQTADLSSIAAYREGLKFLQAGHYEEALNHFHRASRVAPRDPRLSNLEGVTLTALGRLEEANQAYLVALGQNPSFWLARRNLASNFLQKSQVDLAAPEILRVLQEAPQDPLANLLSGQVAFLRKDCSTALSHFARAGKVAQEDVQISLMEAECRISLGQDDRATKLLITIERQPSLQPEIRFKLGWLFGRVRSYDRAVRIFKLLPKDFPDPLSGSYALALAYFELGEYLHCVEVLEQVRSRGIQSRALCSLLGVTYDRLGKFNVALVNLQEATRVDPSDEVGYLNEAALCSHFGRHEQALESITRGIEHIPQAYRLYLARGLLRQQAKGDLKTAELDYMKALNLAPQASDAFGGLALFYIQSGRSREAVQLLKKANSVAPHDPSNYYLLAEALIREGISPGATAFDETLEALNNCLKLDAKFVYAYFNRGKLRLQAGDVNAAIFDLERAREIKPEATDIIYKLAEAYRRAGRKKAAADLFSEREKIGKKSLDDYVQFMMDSLVKVQR